MKRTTLVFAAAVALASSSAFAGDSTIDAAVGGAIGGAVGAAIGNEIGGRDGAVAGGAIGAAAGAAIATDADTPSGGAVAVQPTPSRALPPGLAKKGKVPPGHAR